MWNHLSLSWNMSVQESRGEVEIAPCAIIPTKPPEAFFPSCPFKFELCWFGSLESLRRGNTATRECNKGSSDWKLRRTLDCLGLLITSTYQEEGDTCPQAGLMDSIGEGKSNRLVHRACRDTRLTPREFSGAPPSTPCPLVQVSRKLPEWKKKMEK